MMNCKDLSLASLLSAIFIPDTFIFIPASKIARCKKNIAASLCGISDQVFNNSNTQVYIYIYIQEHYKIYFIYIVLYKKEN